MFHSPLTFEGCNMTRPWKEGYADDEPVYRGGSEISGGGPSGGKTNPPKEPWKPPRFVEIILRYIILPILCIGSLVVIGWADWRILLGFLVAFLFLLWYFGSLFWNRRA